MPDQPEPHACKPDAGMYYCPTSGSTESDCHGGFDVCCDQPQLHVAPDPLAVFRALADQYAAQAAESTRHAKIADDDERRLAHQGWRSAEFLLRHTLSDLDNLRTTPNNPPSSDDAELTAEEARALADELSRDLYRAQDALAFVGECCDIADREARTITTANVREWMKGARCGRQLAADGAPEVEAHDRQRPPSAPTSEDAASHRILTTICERNGYRPPPTGVQITADDLAKIDRMVDCGTPFGEAVGDVIGLAAWRSQQADLVLDRRIRDAWEGSEGVR